jgi:hypothetical protein
MAGGPTKTSTRPPLTIKPESERRPPTGHGLPAFLAWPPRRPGQIDGVLAVGAGGDLDGLSSPI